MDAPDVGIIFGMATTWRGVAFAILLLAVPAIGAAQTKWSGNVAVASYFFPDDDDIVQPTAYADRGPLHLEVRYNYEDTQATSVFAGWNFGFGTRVKLELTPIAGVVAGSLDGGIVGVKADLSWRRLEAYTEGEFVMPGDEQRHFLYSWSEFSIWATDWLRGGVAMQRTRTFRRFRSTREIEPGLLIGVAGSRLEGTFYYFSPGSDDQYFVASIGVSFGGERDE